MHTYKDLKFNRRYAEVFKKLFSYENLTECLKC